jgi:hypothetical protein
LEPQAEPLTHCSYRLRLSRKSGAVRVV